MADDDPAEVEQITRPVAAEAALVVSADIKPLESPQDGWRWFVPAGGVVFARDGTKSTTTTVRDAPGRAGQFPHVTAFIGNDRDPTEDRAEVDKHADNIYVLGVAPDGTRVSGQEVERNRHSFSRISVQVAGTCTLAARETERFRFGDLVCASLLGGDTLRFKGADKGFVTRDLVPWQPNQTRTSPTAGRTRSSPAAISYNLLLGLKSVVAANNNTRLIGAGPISASSTIEVGIDLQTSWSLKTWEFLRTLFPTPQVGDTDEFAGLAFDSMLKAEFEGGSGRLKATENAPKPMHGLISVLSVDNATISGPFLAEYAAKRAINDPANAICPKRQFYGQVWRAVVDSQIVVAAAAFTPLPADPTGPPAAAAAAGAGAGASVTSLTRANQINLMRCLLYEACGRGPLEIPDAMLEEHFRDDDGAWKRQLVDYCTMVDTRAADAIDAEIKKHRRAALRWAGSTTAPFARVLEVGVNELRVELLCHLGAE